MKLFSSILAAATVACAAYALLAPAAAQQSAEPAQAEEKKGDGAAVGTVNTEQRRWVPGNFRMTIGGANEGMVDSVETKQSVATDAIGDVRDYAAEPAAPGDRVVDTPRTEGPSFGAPASSMPRIVAPALRAPVLTVPQVGPVKQDSEEDDDEDDPN